MNKPKSTLLNMVLSLMGVTLIAGALLGGVYMLTSEPIARAKSDAVKAAISEVVPAFTNDPAADVVEIRELGGSEITIYPAYNGDNLVGAAVEGSSNEGFSGNITVMFGFDADGKVYGYRVLSHAETPGLGSKMEKWFRSDVDDRSVIGLDPGQGAAYLKRDKGEVDGITAATISSRAFLDALRSAHKAFINFRNGHSKK